jgi:hypothetical protein
MAVNSAQGFIIRLVANGVQLDLFRDETITVSNNVTGLFDIATLPSEFTRQIQIPGTKKNNDFFKHVYDISVESPYLFATNVKIPAYFDFDGLYISQGYLQLNKVNVKSNKFIESYEISIYGTISSFSRDINKLFLTDLTSLSIYNHTSSYQNIVDSWDKNLLSGDIVYPFADYGSGWAFKPGEPNDGIDSPGGAVTVQDFKPAIRVKKVLDAIFQQTGYSYSSSFFDESWWNDVYMIANNSLKYPEYDGINLELLGVAKWGAMSGSGMTDWQPASSTATAFPWYNTLSDPDVSLGDDNSYYVSKTSAFEGILNLNLNLSSSVNTSVDMRLYYWETGSSPSVYTTLDTFDSFFDDNFNANTGGGGINSKFEIKTKFVTSQLTTGYYYFGLWYNGGLITIDPDSNNKSYIEITKVLQGADGRTMNMQLNMPFGQNGIKCVDFIKALQKKFNLVIYPNKTKINEFIIEPFNYWYNKGGVKNFDKYIDLNQNIEVIPANNFAVNQVEFGDKLGGDYIAQQFQKENIREFGKSYYIDTQNFFSQGELKIETTFEASPLSLISNSGISGSASAFNPGGGGGGGISYAWYVGNQGFWSNESACSNTSYFPYTLWTAESTISGVTTFYTDYNRTTPFNGGYSYWKMVSQYGSVYYSIFISDTGGQFSIYDCSSGGIF